MIVIISAADRTNQKQQFILSIIQQSLQSTKWLFQHNILSGSMQLFSSVFRFTFSFSEKHISKFRGIKYQIKAPHIPVNGWIACQDVVSGTWGMDSKSGRTIRGVSGYLTRVHFGRAFSRSYIEINLSRQA